MTTLCQLLHLKTMSETVHKTLWQCSNQKAAVTGLRGKQNSSNHPSVAVQTVPLLPQWLQPHSLGVALVF